MKLAAALCLVASGAVAQDCPTPDDLDTGITLSLADGSFSMRTTSVRDGIEVTSNSVNANGEVFSSTATFAHPLALPLVVNPNGPTLAVYDLPVQGLDNLPMTREWTSGFEFQVDGETVDTGAQVSRLTGLGQIEIGACAYDVWRVRRQITYGDDLALNSEHVYSPDLGIILGETTLDAEGAPRAALFFDEIVAE